MSEIEPEPRGMTLIDAMALPVGIAVAFGIARLPGSSSGYVPGMITPTGMLLFAGLMLVWGLAMGVAAVTLARSAWFARPVRPGEWLACLLTGTGAAMLHEGFFDRGEVALAQANGWTFATTRWVMAGVESGFLLVGVFFQLGLRRNRTRWLHALWGMMLLIVALIGPFRTVALRGPFLLNLGGWMAETTLRNLVVTVAERICQTPHGLLLAFPSVAVLAAYRRGAIGPWPAWAGPVLAWPVLLHALILGPSFFGPQSPWWFADRGFRLAWTALEWWFAWRVLRWRDRPQPGVGSPAATSSAT